MRCAWNALLGILPQWLRREVDEPFRDTLRELRLRLGGPPELVMGKGSRWLKREVSRDDLRQCVNNASSYSPWSAATAAQGYITAPGGHRIGLCGEAVSRDGTMTGIREVTSLCIRVARDIPGIGARAAELKGNVMILGAPGWGKTTLLRDLIRQVSDRGRHVAVVDERGELFPNVGCFPTGRCTDVLSGCRKAEGIEAVLRTMGPDIIAVDEITARVDCEALVHAGRCGVGLLATAHAGCLEDYQARDVYRQLVTGRLFQNVILLRSDKTWILERMDI